jgi:hypothetical protein
MGQVVSGSAAGLYDPLTADVAENFSAGADFGPAAPEHGFPDRLRHGTFDHEPGKGVGLRVHGVITLSAR